jgi:hypothetical protein
MAQIKLTVVDDMAQIKADNEALVNHDVNARCSGTTLHSAA